MTFLSALFMQSSPSLHERLTKKLVEYAKSNIVANSRKEVPRIPLSFSFMSFLPFPLLMFLSLHFLPCCP